MREAERSGALAKFAGLLATLAELFSVPSLDRVHIFEEDSQTVAFNGGALFFNLRPPPGASSEGRDHPEFARNLIGSTLLLER